MHIVIYILRHCIQMNLEIEITKQQRGSDEKQIEIEK